MVQLAKRSYEIQIGSGALAQVGEQIRSTIGASASRAFVVVDTGVPERFTQRLSVDLESSGFVVTIARITPSEKIKSIETYHDLLNQVAMSGHTRVDPVIALGGGVVGDLSGFVGASYQRGVPVIQCPTTLLSMVDASVGGKTGVNLQVGSSSGSMKLLKNLVGAFHQPKLVVADMDVLDSLDPRHRRAGLAECIKHGMICRGVGDESNHDLMDWMIENLGAIRSFDPAVITELVARNVALKARVVAGDEHESTSAKAGGRMLLNFGHTFGHAIETIDGLSPNPSRPELAPLHHGEAIGLGMVAACHCAHALGLCEESVTSELLEVLSAVRLPVVVEGLAPSDQIMESMKQDKKTAGGEMRLILPTGRGKCEIVTDPDPRSIMRGIDAIRA